MEKFYGEKNFAFGYLTVPDFLFAEISYYVKGISVQLFNSLPYLARVAKAINDLP